MPSPESLYAFGKVDPSLPGRIMAMAEVTAQHERQMEARNIELIGADQQALRAERRRGQYIAGTIAGMCLVACVMVAWFGYPAVASIIGSTTIIGLVAVFVTGKCLPNQQATEGSDSPSGE